FESFLQANQEVEKVVVTFDKNFLKGRPIYGQVSETDLGDRVRLVFLSGCLRYMAHWLLMYGTAVEVESPDKLKETISSLVEELQAHYAPSGLITVAVSAVNS